MLILGYLIGHDRTQPTVAPIVIQNCESSPKIEYVYIRVEQDAACKNESTFESELYGDEIYADDFYEDGIYEDEIDGIYEDEIYEYESEGPYSSENLNHTRNMSNKLLMLGYRKSGAFEAKLKIPVHESLGFYVGYDTDRQYSFGASINLF